MGEPKSGKVNGTKKKLLEDGICAMSGYKKSILERQSFTGLNLGFPVISALKTGTILARKSLRGLRNTPRNHRAIHRCRKKLHHVKKNTIHLLWGKAHMAWTVVRGVKLLVFGKHGHGALWTKGGRHHLACCQRSLP